MPPPIPLNKNRLGSGLSWVVASETKVGPWCWYAMSNLRRNKLTPLGSLNIIGKLNPGGSIYCPEATKGGSYTKHNKRSKRATRKQRRLSA